MDNGKQIKKNENKIVKLESELQTIPNARKVLVKRINDEKGLVEGGLGDKNALVSWEQELSELKKKKENLKEKINSLKKENEGLHVDIKRQNSLNHALEYYKAVIKFSEWKIKQLEKGKKNKELTPERAPQNIIDVISQYRNLPIIRRAFPHNIKV